MGSLLKLQPLYILNAKMPSAGATSCFEAGALVVYSFDRLCMQLLYRALELVCIFVYARD